MFPEAKTVSFSHHFFLSSLVLSATGLMLRAHGIRYDVITSSKDTRAEELQRREGQNV